LPHASLTPAGEERCAADFIALLGMLAEAFPHAPVIVVICDNDSIHHVRKVTAYLKEHPRLELVYGARYSPHDNPAERIWAALKNYLANTAVSWPGRLQQIHAFFRSRSPDKMLATAAPWTSPWLPPVTSRTFGMLLRSTSRSAGQSARRSDATVSLSVKALAIRVPALDSCHLLVRAGSVQVVFAYVHRAARRLRLPCGHRRP
jgi:hypothetical protein